MSGPPKDWKAIRNAALSGGIANGPPEGADEEEFWSRVRRLMTQGFPQRGAIQRARLEFLGLRERT